MSKVFLNLVNISIAASYMVIAVLIIRRIFSKSPKWVNVLLWILVGVRLMMPFSFESIFSLIPSAETFEVNMLESPKFTVNTGFDIIDNALNDHMGDRYFEGVTVAADLKSDIVGIMSAIWLSVMLLLMVYAFFSYFRLKRQIIMATRYKCNIYMSEFVETPFVLGIFKPSIYVPYNISDDNMSYVIAHELAHIKRKDHITKMIAHLLVCVYWFNPVIWIGYAALCKDIELACDESVIKNYDNEDKKAYSEALLNFSVNRRAAAIYPLAFGEIGVKERIKEIMNYKKPAFWIVSVSVFVVLIISVCFLTNPRSFGIADIEDWTERIFDGAEYIYVVSEDNEYLITDEIRIDSSLEALKEIRLNNREVSKSRDETRPMNNIIQLDDNTTICFNEDFTQLWVDNNVKPTYSYRVKNPDYVKDKFFSGYFADVSDDERFVGEIVTDFGGEKPRFEFRNNMGEYIGIIIDEEKTKLIWQDDTIPQMFEQMGITDENVWDSISCGVYVEIIPEERHEADALDWVDAKVFYYVDTLTVLKVSEQYFGVDAKPVIYLYPEDVTDVCVTMDYNGVLTCTYPEYENGWNVTAYPDGTLTDADGMEYNYLYWEGMTDVQYDFSEGFCIKGEDSVQFLEESLAKLGLSRKEANEFIVYWLPIMQVNEYNIISFQTDVYTDNAKLMIDPEPDTFIRVFMAYKPSDEFVAITPQELSAPERNGFTVLEWGGALVH
ncbi:MAG: hypothetical protein E7218_08170 [Anaerofustis stercorihominis]|nr:hypothetical protein [Anaerofustis stercorihominis]